MSISDAPAPATSNSQAINEIQAVENVGDVQMGDAPVPEHSNPSNPPAVQNMQSDGVPAWAANFFSLFANQMVAQQAKHAEYVNRLMELQLQSQSQSVANRSCDEGSRIEELERQLEELRSGKALDNSLLKQLTDMKDFDGISERPWEDFEKEFINKASMVRSLPKTAWVRHMHAHIVGRALDHAITSGLVVNGELKACTFEEYCAVMKQALFGEALTLTAKIHRLMEVTQTDKVADAALFLKEKEKYLNLIPLDELPHNARAALVLWGMDPNLVTAISPNPASADGQFHSYDQVRAAVVNTIGLNRMLLDQNKRQRTNDYPSAPAAAAATAVLGAAPVAAVTAATGAPWKQAKGGGHFHRKSGGGQPSQAGQPYKAGNTGNQQGGGGSTSAGGKATGQGGRTVCKDCGREGHWDAGTARCPKNPNHNPNYVPQHKRKA